MSKPKILVFIDWFVPGYKAGGPIRSCLNMMNHLRNDIDFFVLCLDHDYMSDEPYEGIIYKDWNVVDTNINVRYLRKSELHIPTYQKVIESMDFNAIYINGIYSRHFSINPVKASKKYNIPVIVSVRGMLKESAIAVKKLKKKLFLTLARLTGLYKGITFHVSNEDEKNDVLRNVSAQARVLVAPNLPKILQAKGRIAIKKNRGELKIVSAARISPEKNLMYSLEVMKGLDHGDIVFDIYGSQYNHEYWGQCQELISSLPKNIKVEYKGVVHPDKIDMTLSQYHLMFMPTRGENFGHVILESIIAGTPVLISDQTPWCNLDKENVGRDIPLEDKSSFHDYINTMLEMENKEYQVLHDSCIIFAKEYLADSTALELNKKLFMTS